MLNGNSLGCCTMHAWIFSKTRTSAQSIDRARTRWATECGCGPEWSYAGVVDNFKSLEQLDASGTSIATPHASDPRVDHGVRGAEGHMQPSVLFPPLHEIDSYLSACEANGIPTTDDYNGASQFGAGYVWSCVRVSLSLIHI